MKEQPQVKERDMRESMTAFRKRRGLLSRAYRAYRREANRARGGRSGSRGDLLLKAAGVVNAGQAEGINVGGIQRYDQIQDLVSSRLRQTMANTDALEKALQPSAPQLLPTPTVQPEPQPEPQQVAPLSASQQDDEVIDWETYDPFATYAQQRSLFT